MNEEMRLRVIDWRKKCLSGEATLEDMQAIVQHLRAGRTSSLAVSAIKKEKATASKKPKAVKPDALLEQFKQQVKGASDA